MVEVAADPSRGAGEVPYPPFRAGVGVVVSRRDRAPYRVAVVASGDPDLPSPREAVEAEVPPAYQKVGVRGGYQRPFLAGGTL